MYPLLFAALLFLPQPEPPELKIDVPAALKVEPGQLARVEITGTFKGFGYTIAPAADVDVFREYDPDLQKIVLRIQARREGVYTLVVAGALGDRVKQVPCEITVGRPPPPKPPDPPPVPPAPPDPLQARLQASWEACKAEPDREASRTTAVALYKSMATHAGNADLRTLTDLLADLKVQGASRFPEGSIMPVRRALADEITATLGKPSGAPLTDASRVQASALFNRLAVALAGLK